MMTVGLLRETSQWCWFSGGLRFFCLVWEVFDSFRLFPWWNVPCHPPWFTV